MLEARINSEAQEMLPRAVKEVSELYSGDQLSNLLGTQPPEQRDELWQETAEKFGPFSKKIIELREALKRAYVTREAYPEPVTNVMRLHFSEVEDMAARDLLTDLLFARTITSPGYMDYGMEVVREAQAMVAELGVSGGLRDEALQGVSLEDVVEAVLTDRLKLSRQTQLESR